MTETGRPTILPDQDRPAGADEQAALPKPPSRTEVPPPGQVQIVDVWSRTTPKYRRRSVAFLSVSVLLFCGLACFTHWIRSGVFFAPALDDYGATLWNTFDWRGERQITLTDWLFYPINVQRAPMMLVIIGMTLGTLVVIPILVAILYRLPAALICVAIVAFLAVMPWLAVNILIACRIATIRRIRLRYVAAMLGLVPMVLYFVLATTNPSEVLSQLAPAEQIKLYFPWLWSMIWAALLMGAVLLLARIVNYRPGAIAPLLAVSFAIPVVLFEGQVGRDELYYRLLEREYGPRSPDYFVDLDRQAVIERLAERRLRAGRNASQSLEAIRAEIRDWWAFAPDRVGDELAALQEELAGGQYMVAAACDRFLRDYSKSKYVPSVLYIKARALDMRIDEPLFLRAGRLEHYLDYPSRVSRPAWVTLLTKHPDSDLSAVARLRLARIYAQEGHVGQAIDLLNELEDMVRQGQQTGEQTTSLFEAEPPAASLAVSLPRVLEEGRKLRNLLERNRDPQYDDAPLVLLMQADARHAQYERNLRELGRRYPQSALADNIDLELILQARSRTWRAAQLSRFIQERPEGDAIEQALFELGALLERDAQPERALETWERLLSRYPESPWCVDAAPRIDHIKRHERPRDRT
ncbi:MAG: tetratricopeptide repeat protein [Phycisphaerales bacterium]|nr:MAG: tetratricopeptide repeat protein [Phycisphaerales bacterium]